MQRVRYGNVSFEVPEAWVDFSVVTLAGGDSKTFAPSVTVTRQESVGGDLGAEAKRQLKDIKRQFKGHKLLGDTAVKLGGIDAYLLEHQMLSPERVRVRQMQYFFRIGDDLVVVSLACAQPEMEDRKASFEAIAASFVVHDENRSPK